MDTKSAGGARLNVERTRCLRSAGIVDPPVCRDSPWIRIGRSSRRQDAELHSQVVSSAVSLLFEPEENNL
jgi:hypothetical protein